LAFQHLGSDFSKFRATLERAQQGGLPISSLHIAEIDIYVVDSI